jgi:hypothetical protein
MGARADQLASKLDQSCREINAAVERLSDAEWKTVASAEQWSVGVVAHRVAESHAEEGGFVQMIAKGQPVPPLTMEMIDEGNARHARVHTDVTQAATLALLQANGAQAVAMVRGLSDAELDRSGTLLVGTPPVTAAQAIQELLIDHVYEHLSSLMATTKAT